MDVQVSQYRIPLISATIAVVALVALISYLYLSPTGWKARENAALNQIDEDVPTAYTTLDGTVTDIAAYEGDFLIVNVWASWSPYTQHDHEVLAALKQEFGDRITVRALNRKEQSETAVAYLDTIGRKEEIEYIIDPTDHFYAAFDGYAMPETIVFDKIGNIVLHKRGTLDRNEMSAEIARLLGVTE